MSGNMNATPTAKNNQIFLHKKDQTPRSYFRISILSTSTRSFVIMSQEVKGQANSLESNNKSRL